MSTYIYGSFEFGKTISHEDWVEIHATWTIPRFVELINHEKIKEIDSPILRATPPGQLKQWNSRFKIKHLKSCNKINILFWSPITILLKMKSYLKYYSGMLKNIDVQDCRIVEANMPLSIVSLNLQENCILFADKERYLMDDKGTLKLKFELEVKNLLKIAGVQLVKDMENLFLEGMHTDVVMKSADDEEFKVHKAILASRSPVLKAHFRHNTTEAITNIVESPLESAVLREVLSFIYTDKAPKVDEIPMKLLAAADYYQLSALKSLCEEALHDKLTVDNAIETLQIAELYSAIILEQIVLEFIKQDTEKLIIKTKGWAKLQSVDLLKKIYEYCK